MQEIFIKNNLWRKKQRNKKNKETKLDIMKKKTRMQFGIKKVESQSV